MKFFNKSLLVSFLLIPKIQAAPAYILNGEKFQYSDMSPSAYEKFKTAESDFHLRAQAIAEEDAFERFVAQEEKALGKKCSDIKPFTKEEVVEYFNAHRTRFGTNSFERVEGHLRTLMESRRDLQMKAKVVQSLKEQGKLQVLHP